jgi:hypothetical protein
MPLFLEKIKVLITKILLNNHSKITDLRLNYFMILCINYLSIMIFSLP